MTDNNIGAVTNAAVVRVACLRCAETHFAVEVETTADELAAGDVSCPTCDGGLAPDAIVAEDDEVEDRD